MADECLPPIKRPCRVGSVNNHRIAHKPAIIYALSDPQTGEVRYVGATVLTLERRMLTHERAAKARVPRYIYNWWRSLGSLGLKPVGSELERILVGGDWVEAEQRWIAFHRANGSRLTNLCNGGRGTPGIVFTESHIERLRKSHIGKSNSPEARAKIGAKSKAAWLRQTESRFTPESEAKRQASRKLRGLKKRVPASDATKAKISAAKAGKPRRLRTPDGQMSFGF